MEHKTIDEIKLLKHNFNNPYRHRSYGLRVGDVVNSSWTGIGTVIVTQTGDNNRVVLEHVDGTQTQPTAESCKILKKVEDIEMEVLFKILTRGTEGHNIESFKLAYDLMRTKFIEIAKEINSKIDWDKKENADGLYEAQRIVETQL